MDVYLTDILKELIANELWTDQEYVGLLQNKIETQNLVKPIDKPLHLRSTVSKNICYIEITRVTAGATKTCSKNKNIS